MMILHRNDEEKDRTHSLAKYCSPQGCLNRALQNIMSASQTDRQVLQLTTGKCYSSLLLDCCNDNCCFPGREHSGFHILQNSALIDGYLLTRQVNFCSNEYLSKSTITINNHINQQSLSAHYQQSLPSTSAMP